MEEELQKQIELYRNMFITGTKREKKLAIFNIVKAMINFSVSSTTFMYAFSSFDEIDFDHIGTSLVFLTIAAIALQLGLNDVMQIYYNRKDIEYASEECLYNEQELEYIRKKN